MTSPHPSPKLASFRLPDLFTCMRILGSPLLVVLAGQRMLVPSLIWGGWLLFTEWFDGFLARRLKLASAWGARLDSIADTVFYSSVLLAIVAWRPAVVLDEIGWVLAAVLSFAASQALSWYKFACLPSYHTWSAKTAWCVVVPGILLLMLSDQPWLFRLGMVWVFGANCEAVSITFRLSEPAVDVPTFWHLPRKTDLA